MHADIKIFTSAPLHYIFYLFICLLFIIIILFYKLQQLSFSYTEVHQGIACLWSFMKL